MNPARLECLSKYAPTQKNTRLGYKRHHLHRKSAVISFLTVRRHVYVYRAESIDWQRE